MEKSHKKGILLPTLYLMITLTIFVGVIFIGSSMFYSNDNLDYGISAIRDTSKTVVVESTTESSLIESPVDETVLLDIHYYNSKDNDAMQQSSLIYYQNTYMPNTGVIYTKDESFEVKGVFSGIVEEIKDDEFFGKYIVVKHNDNLKTYYYGFDKVDVNVGDEITSNTVLGNSRINNIIDNKYSFLLEVYHDGKLIDPEDFIGTNFTDYIR